MGTPEAAFIRYLAKKWASSDACQAPLVGCSQAEIEEIKQRQGVNRLPELYVEWMLAMGRQMGGLENFETKLTYPSILDTKAQSFPVLHRQDIFVLTHDAQGDCAIYFHSGEDDPILYWISYDGAKTDYELKVEDWGRLSAWLVHRVEGGIEDYELAENRRKAMQHDPQDTQTSYDLVAEEYAHKYLSELDHKPKDRELLDRFAKQMKGQGRVCDLGCGPGQIGRYLFERGVDAFGLDLSPGMVDLARQTFPDMEFVQGDMSKLQFGDESLAGLTAFYCLIHFSRERVTDVLRELKRVLQPGGLLLLSFHRGSETMHSEEMLGKPVSLDATFFEPDEMQGYLEAAGLHVDEVIQRDPYPEVEYPSQRVYIFASKPSAGV
jgi:ubiquinone/menaquinone biosynthesis C-methylase UbiE